MAHYLVCYDIADHKRLCRVHRRAVRYAAFIQYSVYYLNGCVDDLDVMLSDIQSVMDESEDDVRAYSVEPLNNAIRIGTSWLPDDIFLQ